MIKKTGIFFGVIILLLSVLLFCITQPILGNFEFENPIENNVSDANLKKHVKYLSELNRTTENGQTLVVNYILQELKENGILEDNIVIQEYEERGRVYKNIIVHFNAEDKSLKKIIVGAHYDAFGEFPGANDNASGIAGLLEMSQVLNATTFKGRNVDLVFYSTEEPPHFATKGMGSYHHAKSIENETNIELVMVFDMIGCYDETENSQHYPIGLMKYFYPSSGNFIAVVSNFSNIFPTRNVKKRFKSFIGEKSLIDVASMNAPSFVQGIDFSDHRNYWRFGFDAVLITDTAFMRSGVYHTKDDTYEKLNYLKMKEVIGATIATVLSY